MKNLLLFSEKTSPRLAFVCRLVFEQHLGLSFSLTKDIQVFTQHKGPKISYGLSQAENTIFIQSVGLLFEDGIRQQEIKTGLFNNITVPFFSGIGAMPFDVFSAIFYLTSRYEEYLAFEPNQYGQFKAKDSLPYKLNFLDKPVVDIWTEDLKNILHKNYSELVFKKKEFATTFTYDIDVAYAYKGRQFAITAINTIKDVLSLHFSAVKERLSVLNNSKRDPFDTYEDIILSKEKHQHNLLLFFLLGPKNKYNRNLNPYSKGMKLLMQTLSKQSAVGIHPSYYTSDNYLQLQHEKLLLESVIDKKVNQSRQHYLRLIFPDTYQNLLQVGITDDYTLGFAELPGFRAGTCTAFNFYDVKAEAQTSLTLHPNTFMEGTFIEDMQLSAANTLPLMKKLIDEVKKVNGHFISIWHNHSLSNKKVWEGLKEVHDAIAAYTAKKQS